MGWLHAHETPDAKLGAQAGADTVRSGIWSTCVTVNIRKHHPATAANQISSIMPIATRLLSRSLVACQVPLRVPLAVCRTGYPTYMRDVRCSVIREPRMKSHFRVSGMHTHKGLAISMAFRERITTKTLFTSGPLLASCTLKEEAGGPTCSTECETRVPSKEMPWSPRNLT